jgi:hypothetical protein
MSQDDLRGKSLEELEALIRAGMDASREAARREGSYRTMTRAQAVTDYLDQCRSLDRWSDQAETLGARLNEAAAASARAERDRRYDAWELATYRLELMGAPTPIDDGRAGRRALRAWAAQEPPG